MKRGHKYGAVPTTIDGIRFASKAEAKRYGELKILEKAGEITALKLQPKFALEHGGMKIAAYIADFSYVAIQPDGSGRYVVEDVKGMKTAVYNIKKKLMRACHGIEITEITR